MTAPKHPLVGGASGRPSGSAVSDSEGAPAPSAAPRKASDAGAPPEEARVPGAPAGAAEPAPLAGEMREAGADSTAHEASAAYLTAQDAGDRVTADDAQAPGPATVAGASAVADEAAAPDPADERTTHDPADEAEARAAAAEAAAHAAADYAEARAAAEQAAGPAPSAGPKASTASAAADDQKLLERLIAKAEKADEYLRLAQRTQADFENYRKRAARDAAAAQERGVVKLARELLPAVDDLDRALAAAEAAGEGNGNDTLVSGIKLVHADVIAALARAGIQRFSPEGEAFDPQSHEAVAQQPVDGAAPGTIVEVYQRGYRLGDAVIRPARVVVAG
jgi:molecular chaperone GrpE